MHHRLNGRDNYLILYDQANIVVSHGHSLCGCRPLQRGFGKVPASPLIRRSRARPNVFSIHKEESNYNVIKANLQLLCLICLEIEQRIA
jgi:hypothetical protein